MTQEQIARGLNEWMRRYVDEPTRFAAEFQTVGQFLKDEADGVEPSYGVVGASYLSEIIEEFQ